jgi:tRNA(Arg) A34 adenosine deaminase TadA
MSTRQGTDGLAGGGRDLSPAQRALAGGDDVLGRLPGAHAEITAMEGAGKAGLTPWQMAVSRPICPACQSAIEGSGGTVAPGGMFAWLPW